MTDLQEELAKLLASTGAVAMNVEIAHRLADCLLPFVQAQVDAAVKGEREQCAGLMQKRCNENHNCKHFRTIGKLVACYEAAAIRFGEK